MHPESHVKGILWWSSSSFIPPLESEEGCVWVRSGDTSYFMVCGNNEKILSWCKQIETKYKHERETAKKRRARTSKVIDVKSTPTTSDSSPGCAFLWRNQEWGQSERSECSVNESFLLVFLLMLHKNCMHMNKRLQYKMCRILYFVCIRPQTVPRQVFLCALFAHLL